jgi:hypothetical protein
MLHLRPQPLLPGLAAIQAAALSAPLCRHSRCGVKRAEGALVAPWVLGRLYVVLATRERHAAATGDCHAGRRQRPPRVAKLHAGKVVGEARFASL